MRRGIKGKAKTTLTVLVLLLLIYVLLPALSEPPAASAPLPAAPAQGELKVYFLDVGQGDSILVCTNGEAMLIDAGNPGQEALLEGYLTEAGVSKLDYLVATHPHADHIGAMAGVINSIEEIGTVLMPQAVANTVSFEKLLAALEKRELAVTVPEPGYSFALGEATVEILAPLAENYKDLNNYSLVLRLSYGDIRFLFTGDAEALSETEQLAAGRELSATVLKLGHHGSNSSSSAAYLRAVAPLYAVISCGAGNSYGHPHREVLERLQERGIEVYRTDQQGSIIFRTDGQGLTIETEKTPER